ncbi:PAS domain-containing protein [Roseomonas sp. PWR1]|uniref:histidine kinase n=1 Tax=Roseomonas nitratireducens TaxID=2820810 RepID=A0ABS4B110_9PROT|nr:chemotaxis protein CheB [Neoroseomonas nitratireducens]MBP0466542.1 PAS domain-containing protein [Neoroseomonas nitratireducens]
MGDDILVVGIGASAGGLDACRRMIEAIADGSGMALILVQHLDPDHESMLVDLLATHTGLTVCQVVDGMPIERGHLYVIPPGTYLSVGKGALHLTEPAARHGARLPFDFLLHSLAEEMGPRAACVVLSGTGSDGSLGLQALKQKGGLVIAQDPDEAAYDGMPRSAIATGAVDLVLPAAGIPAGLADHVRRKGLSSGAAVEAPPVGDMLPAIVDLLHATTSQDFRLYKPGTLRRRIERRMSAVAIAAADMHLYLEKLRHDPVEVETLAKDLLIHVTSFFRDAEVFDLLAETVIPELVEAAEPGRPLRVWVPGCSTGEEAYSLAILFQERIAATGRDVKLQIFGSDVDPDAVAAARDGLYPPAIRADVTPERLARFFTQETQGYRVSSDLRASVVFTVQDVLNDAPFSRLDMVSCRNLLIYLSPEAQAKVIALFHFALRPGGILLLGGAETIGSAPGRFEVISKPGRIYRHIGRSRPGELGLIFGAGTIERAGRPPARATSAARANAYGELCRRLVMERFAPAAVLVDQKQECLYSLGPTDRFLRVPPGAPTQDLLAMAPRSVRNKLRAAIQRAIQENGRVSQPGGLIRQDGRTLSFSIDVQPILSEGERLLLVCFVEDRAPDAPAIRTTVPRDVPRIAELEQELEATRTELQGAIHNLEIANEEQKAISEEALSASEEYQSTNEELLTSKEELQSLNEELTALNTQLQETLERQRTTANDLQNVLYSTDVATLFLDTELRIRFFTPATKDLVSVIPGDIGRPLSDLNLLASDSELLADARTVLRTRKPIEREIMTRGTTWYSRRILPYRTQDDGVEGVVITFVDITERRLAGRRLEEAKRQAEYANGVKSRFLAAASHDLRQPLQTLTLLQGLLAKSAKGEKTHDLVKRLGETLGAMSGMLNTLLDINQIEAGTIRPEIVRFPVDDLLERLRGEFTYHAEAQRLGFHVVPCGLAIESDPRLLEQILRNLLSNALKYTRRGKVLLGCRRHGGQLRIEVWDTGIGIPDSERQAVFEEYHQLDNPARERGRGLGLGLSIARRMAELLGHRISVRSWPGKGSVFAVEMALPSGAAAAAPGRVAEATPEAPAAPAGRHGAILVIEDDPDLRDALRIFVEDEGHRAVSAADGVAALEMVAQGVIRPDLILADYNLPRGMTGVEVARTLRKRLRHEIPAIILTGDISTATLRDIALPRSLQLHKPVRLQDLARSILDLLAAQDEGPARGR